MADLHFYSVAHPDGDGECEVVVAASPDAALGLLDGSEVARLCGSDDDATPDPSVLRATLVEGADVPVGEVPGPARWRTYETATRLRDHLFCYGPDSPEGDRCDACGRDSFEGWAGRPAEWAVCSDCGLCGECAADDDSERCGGCDLPAPKETP